MNAAGARAVVVYTVGRINNIRHGGRKIDLMIWCGHSVSGFSADEN